MAECLDTTTGACVDVLPIDCPDGLIQWGPYRLDHRQAVHAAQELFEAGIRALDRELEHRHDARGITAPLFVEAEEPEVRRGH